MIQPGEIVKVDGLAVEISGPADGIRSGAG